MPDLPQSTLKDDARSLAAAWRASLAPAPAAPAQMDVRSSHQDLTIDALAEFIAVSVLAGETLLLVVPDDECLPELSNALDLALRPLCLVLPGQGFAAGIALRATLALLRSRLSRVSEAAWCVAWESQHSRLDRQAALWQLTLNWSSSSQAFGARPAQISELFPVCIFPVVHAEAIGGAPRDLLLVFHPERMSATLPKLLTLGKRTLLLREVGATDASSLAPIDERARLNAEYELLSQELGDIELEFATVQAELAEFTRLYHEQVGARMTELDELHARIARRSASQTSVDETARYQADQAQAQADRSRREYRRFTELDREVEKPFAPSGDLKRLFRQLAQKIHPDRAEDDADRAWRSELMSEANRAYRAGDEMVLREILSHWQSGRQDRPFEKPRDPGTRGLARQVARMQRRLADLEAELNRLLASRLYELFVAAGLARQRGRDLLLEMVGQLDAQIELARQQLAQSEAA